jgi:hypothetical protein
MYMMPTKLVSDSPDEVKVIYLFTKPEQILQLLNLQLQRQRVLG